MHAGRRRDFRRSHNRTGSRLTPLHKHNKSRDFRRSHNSTGSRLTAAADGPGLQASGSSSIAITIASSRPSFAG